MILKNSFILFAFILLCGILVSCHKGQPVKPNIIFIIADDQSFNTIHDHGNYEIHTPNLDKLAAQGVTFTHAFNMGAWHGAVCIASRTMINTGKFLWRAEKIDRDPEHMADQELMWSQIMQRAGYDTYFSGKWHVNIKPERIFNHVVHVRPGMPGTVPEAYNRPHEGQTDDWSPSDTTIGGYWKGGKHWSEVLADDAISFIDTASKNHMPFFMYLAFNAPHDPRQSPVEYIDMYPLERISIPESFMPDYPFKEYIGCDEKLRDERLAPFPRTEYSVKVHRQEYYAIITHMDTQLGRILNALEKSGVAKNTYIFFTADHGLACGNHGLFGKQNMYDHSLRPPLLVSGPDIPANKKLDMNVYLQDIMATAIELSGLEKPEHVEFNSLIPYIKGETDKSVYPSIYGAYMNLQRMIRDDQYKLIVYPFAEKLLLYDIMNDPLELIDLSEDPSKQNIILDMFTRLEILSGQMGDTLKLRNFFPNIVSL
jgi:arylsulfatase A-like enzyme